MAERAAIRRYQARDRTYEVVAAVLRGQLTPGDLTAENAELVSGIIDALIPATNRWRLFEPVRLHRGQRRASRVVGTRPQTGRLLIAETFVSTTIHRQVAIDEFTRPSGPGGPALLEVEAPAGTPGLWLPPAGDPDLAYQGEFVCLARPASPSGARGKMQVSSSWTARCCYEPIRRRSRRLPTAWRAATHHRRQGPAR